MFSAIRKILFVTLLLPVLGIAQEKPIKGIDPNATLDQTRTWLVEALTKYGSTKSRTTSSNVSNVKFTGCTIAFTLVRKVGATSNAVMGTTRTVNSIKQEHSVDLSRIDGVKVSEPLYPEFETLLISWRLSGQIDTRVIELPIKQGAAEPIKFALDHARALCPAGK